MEKIIKKLKCNICGWETTDILNKGGHAGKHLKVKHEIDTKEFSSFYTNIEEIKEIMKCPYCDWTTNDLDNKSGMFTSHLQKEHNITPEDYVNKTKT